MACSAPGSCSRRAWRVGSHVPNWRQWCGTNGHISAAATAVHRLVDEYGEVALAQFAAALESADPDRLARLREGVGRLEVEDQHE